jgi:hypothetical protein
LQKSFGGNLMPKNKVLYVKDEDVKLWDQAKRLLASRGESLSSHLVGYLRKLVSKEKK